MPAIVLVLRPTTLQVLCAVGFLYGGTLFVHTIRQRRNRFTRTDAPSAKQPTLNPNLIAKPSPRPPASSVQVIRLSPKNAAAVASMTQQQKIAAALIKARTSNSRSPYDSDPDIAAVSRVQVITAPIRASADDPRDDSAHSHRAPAQPAWKINLMFSISVVLTMLSLYFFLKSLG